MDATRFFRETKKGSLVAVEQGAGLDADFRNAVVGAVFEVAQKPLDERHRNEVAHIVELEVGLKCNPDDLALLHHRSAAVAWIDCSVCLDEQVRIHSGMDIGAELDT